VNLIYDEKDLGVDGKSIFLLGSTDGNTWDKALAPSSATNLLPLVMVVALSLEHMEVSCSRQSSMAMLGMHHHHQASIPSRIPRYQSLFFLTV